MGQEAGNATNRGESTDSRQQAAGSWSRQTAQRVRKGGRRRGGEVLTRLRMHCSILNLSTKMTSCGGEGRGGERCEGEGKIG
jgi:hypothetical protein